LLISLDEKEATEMLLKKMALTSYQVGKTKVFLRAGQMGELDARRAEVLSNAAKTIQRQVRAYLARRHFTLMCKSTIIVQTLWRGKILWLGSWLCHCRR
jgi:myosin-5